MNKFKQIQIILGQLILNLTTLQFPYNKEFGIPGLSPIFGHNVGSKQLSLSCSRAAVSAIL